MWWLLSDLIMSRCLLKSPVYCWSMTKLILVGVFFIDVAGVILNSKEMLSFFNNSKLVFFLIFCFLSNYGKLLDFITTSWLWAGGMKFWKGLTFTVDKVLCLYFSTAWSKESYLYLTSDILNWLFLSTCKVKLTDASVILAVLFAILW